MCVEPYSVVSGALEPRGSELVPDVVVLGAFDPSWERARAGCGRARSSRPLLGTLGLSTHPELRALSVVASGGFSIGALLQLTLWGSLAP